ncbi:MAG: immunity protein Tsi6 family protein [Neisseriaceae bacterium]
MMVKGSAKHLGERRSPGYKMDEETREKCLFYVDRALRLAEKRYAKISVMEAPDDRVLSPMYASILNQLIYLHRVVTGEEKDIYRISTFTMGAYAAREFGNSDPLFADRIHSASYIAGQIRLSKKKIHLPDDPEKNPDYWAQQAKLKAEYPEEYDL